MKHSWIINEITNMPKRKGGAGLREDTKALINDLKKKEGKIIQMTFTNKSELWKYLNRIRYAESKKLINFNSISRQGESIYIDMRKKREEKK